MVWLARFTILCYPCHGVQRGNKRQPIVLNDMDCTRLLGGLGQCDRWRMCMQYWGLPPIS